VKLGAKDILILAPIFKCPAKDVCEEEHSRLVIAYRGVYVFDVFDTQGSPLPQIGQTQGDPAGYTDRLKEFVARSGIRLEYSEAIYPAMGRSSPGKIELLAGQSPAEEFATLAHETAHLRIHQGPRRAETTKCVHETEAEAVAYVVCEAIGLKAQRGGRLYSALLWRSRHSHGIPGARAQGKHGDFRCDRAGN
jgi:hypothetical protein